MGTTSPRALEDHAAGARVRRCAVVRAGNGSRVRADVARGGPRRLSLTRAGAFHTPRRRRRQRADRARRRRIDPRVSQRLPPSRHAAVHRKRRHVSRQHPVSVSRVDLRARRPAAGRAADGRGRGLRLRRTIRSARWRAKPGTATSSSTSPILRRRWRRNSASCRSGSRRGRCRTCGWRTASSTTSPRTGSWWSRTTTSACTAR